MSKERKVVITTCGKDNMIDKITISVFEDTESSWESNLNFNANAYCRMINSFKLEGNSWVHAEVVSENTPLSLNELLPQPDFSKFISRLDDRAIQKVLREVDFSELAIALKQTTDEAKEIILGNMSKNAQKLIKEDIEALGPVGLTIIEETQQKIVSIIWDLVHAGEIIIPIAGEGRS